MEVLLEVEKAINGDKEAFSKIIKLYENKLYIITKSRISNNEDIKDVIQETIMYAYKNIKKLKHVEKFNSWITTILINNCNKIYLKNKLKPVSYEDNQLDNINLSQDNCYDSLHNDLDFFMLIDFLNIDDKTLISMYYLQGYTTKEISEILKVNESTIRSRISNVRNKIKNKLEKGSKNDK